MMGSGVVNISVQQPMHGDGQDRTGITCDNELRVELPKTKG